MITRRKFIIIIAIFIVLSTLFYVEHPSIIYVKKVFTSIGLLDSSQTIIGLTDIRLIDHVRGNKDSDIVLFEYSDYGCILCAAMQENFDRIVREENILLVSRHLYLTQNSKFFNRAIAAECVYKHGGEEKYFDFSRFLYNNQSSIDDEKDLLSKAISLGIDSTKFQGCLSGDEDVRNHILNDSRDGWNLGARGTPYIVVVYKQKPIGISYANEYSRFLTRVKGLVKQAEF